MQAGRQEGREEGQMDERDLIQSQLPRQSVIGDHVPITLAAFLPSHSCCRDISLYFEITVYKIPSYRKEAALGRRQTFERVSLQALLPAKASGLVQ